MKPFPFKIQYDSMLCGITCLQMVCEYYGKRYSEEYLSKYCHTTHEGTSLYSISEAATSLGLQTICGRATIDMLTNAPLPCILHWNQNHYVVLFKIKNSKYYIADPAKGIIKYEKSQLTEHWISTKSGNEDKGIGLFFRLTPDFLKHKTADTKTYKSHSLSFLYSYVKQYRRFFSQITLGLIAGSAIQLIFPFLTQAVIDLGINGKDLNIITLILLAQLMLTISSTAISYIRNKLLLHISMRINISLVSDFFIKLLKLPMSFFDTKMLGDLIQRMNDHRRVEQFMTSSILNILFAIITLSIFSIVLLIYNKAIFIIFITASIIYSLWITMFIKRRKVIDYEMFEQQARNSNKTYQFFNSMQEIKLQDCEQRRRWEWEDIQADMFDINLKALNLQQTQTAGSLMINEIKNIIITITTATLVINGEITLGMMMAIQYIIGQLNTPINTLVEFIYSWQDVSISLERINEILRKPEEVTDNQKLIIPTNIENIKCRNLHFKYNPHHPEYTLKNININFCQGTTTAIVGASGSGKTTLLKLLLGYYPAISGTIEIADTDISAINLKEWRKRCGVVMQDGVIFSESIARNIAATDDDIDLKRLTEAAQTACIDDFINSLPLKYNTEIGPDGIGISQGQRQRILIARAIYRNPDFIFLDEATNALDANTERSIVENLNQFFKGRTVIIIAHRLSTVKNADNIIVLDHGQIVEQGSHHSLVNQRGEYYRLVKNQLELGL